MVFMIALAKGFVEMALLFMAAPALASVEMALCMTTPGSSGSSNSEATTPHVAEMRVGVSIVVGDDDEQFRGDVGDDDGVLPRVPADVADVLGAGAGGSCSENVS